MKQEGMDSANEFQHPLLSVVPGARAKKGKVVSAEEAVRVIRNGDTVATGGPAAAMEARVCPATNAFQPKIPPKKTPTARIMMIIRLAMVD